MEESHHPELKFIPTKTFTPRLAALLRQPSRVEYAGSEPSEERGVYIRYSIPASASTFISVSQAVSVQEDTYQCWMKEPVMQAFTVSSDGSCEVEGSFDGSADAEGPAEGSAGAGAGPPQEKASSAALSNMDSILDITS